MSIDVMSWVWNNSKTKGAARWVLLALADHAAKDGSNAWPSIETLTKYTQMSERGVYKALAELRTEGRIVAGETRQRHGVVNYTVIMSEELEASLTPEPRAPLNDVQGAHSAPPTLHHVQSTPAPRAEDPAHSSPEPSLTKNRTVSRTVKARAREATRLDRDWLPDPNDHQAMGFTNEQATVLLAEFRDYWCSLADGPRARRTDWQAVWRNALRRPQSQRLLRSPNGAVNGRRPSTIDATVAQFAEAAQRYAADTVDGSEYDISAMYRRQRDTEQRPALPRTGESHET